MFHVAAVIERSNKMYRPGFCPSRNNVSLARVMIWEASQAEGHGNMMHFWKMRKYTQLRLSTQT